MEPLINKLISRLSTDFGKALLIPILLFSLKKRDKLFVEIILNRNGDKYFNIFEYCDIIQINLELCSFHSEFMEVDYAKKDRSGNHSWYW